jgi:hypothetical protein
MSISAVSGVAQVNQKPGQPPAASPSPAVTPFGQQLDDVQSTQTMAAHGHHHRHGGQSQSTASAPASGNGAAPTAGSIASSLLSLLS